MCDWLLLLAAILARWWRPVAFIEALHLLYWAMCLVSYRYITMAIKTAKERGAFFDCCFVWCCLGGRRGDTMWILVRWRHPAASMVAMGMPCIKPFSQPRDAAQREGVLKSGWKKVYFFALLWEGKRDLLGGTKMDFMRLRNESKLTMLSVEISTIGPNIFFGVDASECPIYRALT